MGDTPDTQDQSGTHRPMPPARPAARSEVTRARTASILGILGAVPFVLMALAIVFTKGPMADFALMALMGYGAVILSFLGGIVWGHTLNDDGAVVFRLIYSVIPSLMAWSALIMPTQPGLVVLMGGFVMAAIHDMGVGRLGGFPRWFTALRRNLTIIVMASLLIAFIEGFKG
ncbi:DUF3429 domain-containing protein [Yunchengibacter salinarum]|uniref:DUF3429 domain-containing protein n=1 Tax=Yunchengibacter salinarum TaxID=3133399 RepID=UPI0035B59177